MSKKRHKPEEIVAKLRQVEVLTAQGRSVAEAIHQGGSLFRGQTNLLCHFSISLRLSSLRISLALGFDNIDHH